MAPPACRPGGGLRDIPLSPNAKGGDTSVLASAPPPSPLSDFQHKSSTPHDYRESPSNVGVNYACVSELRKTFSLQSPLSEDPPSRSGALAATTSKKRQREPSRRKLPHFFATHSSVLRQRCHQCGKHIAFKKKFLKCSVCQLLCHAECELDVPQDCGLPCPASPVSSQITASME